jgi:hypothetical protein
MSPPPPPPRAAVPANSGPISNRYKPRKLRLSLIYGIPTRASPVHRSAPEQDDAANPSPRVRLSCRARRRWSLGRGKSRRAQRADGLIGLYRRSAWWRSPRRGGAPVVVMPFCEASSKRSTCRHNHHVTGTPHTLSRGSSRTGSRRPPQLLPRLLVRVSSRFILLHAWCSTECVLYIFCWIGNRLVIIGHYMHSFYSLCGTGIAAQPYLVICPSF